MMFDNWHDLTKRSAAPHRGVVTTAQIDWELMQLVEIYDRLDPMRTLEIGSQFGGTLYYWLTGADDGACVANIDILQNMTDADKLKLPDQWRSWCPYGVEYRPFIGRSDDPDIIAAVKEFMPELDFLFIDACHTYEGARADFLQYGPLVRKGGVIALHDLITPEFSPHIQVWQLWREIQAAGYVTQELRAGGAYGGIGVVYV